MFAEYFNLNRRILQEFQWGLLGFGLPMLMLFEFPIVGFIVWGFAQGILFVCTGMPRESRSALLSKKFELLHLFLLVSGAAAVLFVSATKSLNISESDICTTLGYPEEK